MFNFFGSDGIRAHDLRASASLGQISAKMLQITSTIKHRRQDLHKEVNWSMFPATPSCKTFKKLSALVYTCLIRIKTARHL